MSHQDAVHGPGQPEPKELDEEAEDFITLVDADHLVVVQLGHTGLGLEAVLLGGILKGQAVGTDLRKRRELRPLQ